MGDVKITVKSTEAATALVAKVRAFTAGSFETKINAGLQAAGISVTVKATVQVPTVQAPTAQAPATTSAPTSNEPTLSAANSQQPFSRVCAFICIAIFTVGARM